MFSFLSFHINGKYIYIKTIHLNIKRVYIKYYQMQIEIILYSFIKYKFNGFPLICICLNNLNGYKFSNNLCTKPNMFKYV